jgi:hypothetical protein
MTQQATIDTAATFDEAKVNEVLAVLPREVHTEARLRLAALANAATAEERQRVKDEVVDATLRAARDGGWCDSAIAALNLAFGEPEGGRWFDSDGMDRHGVDRDGYNRDGFDTAGYNRDGLNRNGRDRDGYDKDGLDHEGYDRDGFNRDGFNRDGANREGLDKWGLSPYRFGPTGYDSDGFDRQGFNREGWDREGFNTEGENAEGVNRAGESRFRFDQRGYDREGYRGSRTGFGDRNGYTREQNAQAGRPPYVLDDHPLYPAYIAWYNAQR